MSTIAKISPVVRRRRDERRLAVRWHQMNMAMNPNKTLRTASAAAFIALGRTLRDSSIPGEHKEKLFTRIKAEYAANVAKQAELAELERNQATTKPEELVS